MESSLISQSKAGIENVSAVEVESERTATVCDDIFIVPGVRSHNHQQVLYHAHSFLTFLGVCSYIETDTTFREDFPEL